MKHQAFKDHLFVYHVMHFIKWKLQSFDYETKDLWATHAWCIKYDAQQKGLKVWSMLPCI